MQIKSGDFVEFEDYDETDYPDTEVCFVFSIGIGPINPPGVNCQGWAREKKEWDRIWAWGLKTNKLYGFQTNANLRKV